jgi:hypothetical protein
MAAVATFCSLVLLPRLRRVGVASGAKVRPVKNGELSLGYATRAAHESSSNELYLAKLNSY